MDQQGRCSRTDILDLSVLSFGESDVDSHGSAWHGSLETNPMVDTLKKQSLGAGMSERELKIRNELEMDIEKDLEEEIKDGICHHALRLFRLYQSQKERNAKEVSGFETQGQQLKNRKKLLEVNISIRMEGGTKIEIKETKKEAHEKVQPRTFRSEMMQAPLVLPTKKFDWVKTLRTDAGPAVTDGENGGSYHAKGVPRDLRKKAISFGSSFNMAHKEEEIPHRSGKQAVGLRRPISRLSNRTWQSSQSLYGSARSRLVG